MASYLSETNLKELNNEIQINGFMPDELLISNKDIPVYGLNIAVGWPLPEEIRNKYEELSTKINKFDPYIYVYPHYQTHITVMTLVNFKDHINPSKEHVERINDLKFVIHEKISEILNKAKLSYLKPFTIDIGFPVLSSKAIFLPILNISNEIERLREIIGHELKNEVLINPQIPLKIHSTIGRFIEKIEEPNKFIREFEELTSKHIIGTATINEILFTSETKPYMRDGEILYRYKI